MIWPFEPPKETPFTPPPLPAPEPWEDAEALIDAWHTAALESIDQWLRNENANLDAWTVRSSNALIFGWILMCAFWLWQLTFDASRLWLLFRSVGLLWCVYWLALAIETLRAARKRQRERRQ